MLVHRRYQTIELTKFLSGRAGPEHWRHSIACHGDGLSIQKSRHRLKSVSGNSIPCSFPVHSLFRFALRTHFSPLTLYSTGTYPKRPTIRARNSLYFSLLAGNWGGERFARDCVHRHAVWTSRVSREIRVKTLSFRAISSTIWAVFFSPSPILSPKDAIGCEILRCPIGMSVSTVRPDAVLASHVSGKPTTRE